MRLTVVGLYLLLLSSLVETAITLRLFATKNVDGVISISLIVAFVSVSASTHRLGGLSSPADHSEVADVNAVPRNSFISRSEIQAGGSVSLP